MAGRIIDVDPITGIITKAHYDEMDDTVSIETIQDTSANLEYSRNLQKDEDYWKHGVKQSMAHAAHIPAAVIQKWMNEFGVNVFDPNHMNKVRSLLNSPEYAYLRTTSKRI